MAYSGYKLVVLALSAFVATCSGVSAAPNKRPAVSHAHGAHHHALPHRRVGALYHRGLHHGSPTTSAPVPAPHHPRVVAFVDGYVQPSFPTPYPFDGRLAGDGILHTGILDSNVLRQAYGIAPN